MDGTSKAKPISADTGFPANDPTVTDPSRTLLGFDQEDWLTERLSLSQPEGTTWRLLGQQVMMAQLSPSNGQTLFNVDQWDGYIAARQRLFDTVRTIISTTSWCSPATFTRRGPTS